MRLDVRSAIDPQVLQALLDLWVAAWAATMPSIDFEARRAWFADHLSVLLAGSTCLIMARHEAGDLLGFTTLHADTGELDQLAVAPAQAGRGVGTALLDEAKRRAPAYGLSLSVNQSNARAIRLYARQGFVTTGESLNLRSGLPILLMRWTNPGSPVDRV